MGRLPYIPPQTVGDIARPVQFKFVIDGEVFDTHTISNINMAIFIMMVLTDSEIYGIHKSFQQINDNVSLTFGDVLTVFANEIEYRKLHNLKVK